MPVSKKHQDYANNYVRENYDRLLLTLKPKGKKEELRKHAQSMGESLNAFLSRAADEQMRRDNESKSAELPEQEPPALDGEAEAPPSENGSAE